MTLEATFQNARGQLQQLFDTLVGVRVTIIEDRPLMGDSVLVTRFGDAVEDALGDLTQAIEQAMEGEEAVGYPTDLERARRALTTCHECFNRMARRVVMDMMAYERMGELARLARERRGEWAGWASSVRKALESCSQPLAHINEALFACWREVAERASMGSVSVQATNIGQQITVPQDQHIGQGLT
ncbi:MAG TPA: hypothetical protein VKU00_15610 [Chthonomonadaceae bacterium]|nr:hypothetical protein [Chthonomonadaceae bacterium]